ncbi:hypothetical protein HYH02_000490 [Chlamydomonas schloesseri]|uniref:Uncharacterized protein n=1 Tax=Chlamydomonas schloesseri TaxID=2026947 RepID=A0A835WYJ4_9CHLO|nr:hypothetical protein HYH02_000490 [Chlamydomonas schloesseri]|eukprot:KAG2454650.1 hypothetical protein HYH02_000490 [Chlamydomonas schloesseri]
MHGPFAAPPEGLRDAISAQQPIVAHSPDITCHLRPIVSAPQPRTPSGAKGGPTQKKLECQIMSPTRKTAAKTGKWNYSVSADGSAAALSGASAMPHTPAASEACGGGGAGSGSAAVAGLGGAAAKGKGLRLPLLAPMSSAEVSPTSAAVGALNALTMAGTPVGLSAGLMDPRSPPS